MKSISSNTNHWLLWCVSDDVVDQLCKDGTMDYDWYSQTMVERVVDCSIRPANTYTAATIGSDSTTGLYWTAYGGGIWRILVQWSEQSFLCCLPSSQESPLLFLHCQQTGVVSIFMRGRISCHGDYILLTNGTYCKVQTLGAVVEEALSLSSLIIAWAAVSHDHVIISAV